MKARYFNRTGSSNILTAKERRAMDAEIHRQIVEKMLNIEII